MKSKYLLVGVFISILSSSFCVAQAKVPTIDYKKAFADNNLTRLEIGKSNFPTGNIAVADPLVSVSLKPYSKSFAPGKYPVEILLSKVEEDFYKIAFAILKIKPEPAVKWELAITSDITQAQLKTMKKGEYFGFKSESQLASFFDIEIFEKYESKRNAYYVKKPEGSYYNDILTKEFKKFSGSNKYSLDIGDWNYHKVDKNNIFPMFSTGGNKGIFPVYWGLNKAGEIVECVIDFFVVDLK